MEKLKYVVMYLCLMIEKSIVKKHVELLNRLEGKKGRFSSMINERLQEVMKILKSVDRVTESSIIETALLLYFACIWDTLSEDKKTGIKLLLGDDEVFKVGEEIKKLLIQEILHASEKNVGQS